MKKKYLFMVFVVTLLLNVSLMLNPAEVSAKTYRLNLSSVWTLSYHFLVDPVLDFAKKVEERTHGDVKITVYPAGQLFKGAQEFPALERGELDMSALNDVYITGIIPELGVISLPFQWADNESFQRSLSAGLLDLGIKEKFKEHNAILLSAASGGGYQIYSKEQQVTSPKDFEGKIWGVSGSTASKTCEALGGSPTTMSSGELYLALQRGTIDGTTRPLITGSGRKLHEVVKNLNIANMYYYTSMLLINKEVWDDLPKEYQDIMQQAAYERDAMQLKMLKEYEAGVVEEFTSKGIDVHIPSQAEREALKEKVGPVYDWWYGMVDNGKKYTDFIAQHH